MFNVNAQPSALTDTIDIINILESVVTPLGSLQLIETGSVNNIIAGLGRNIYFPLNTSKPIILNFFILYSIY